VALGSLLRERGEGGEARVGFAELFFDLVFVFAVTQLSCCNISRRLARSRPSSC
jgi:low temperature requirement protein LtrA